MFFSLKFGIENIAKNKGRSLAALVGSLLAITLIAGANISVDVATNKILLIALDNTPIDMIVGFPGAGGSDVVPVLEGLEGIGIAEPMLVGMTQMMVNESGLISQAYVNLFGVESSFDRVAGRLLPKTASFDLKENELLVTKGFIDNLRGSGVYLQIGDNFTFYLPKGPVGGEEPEWVAQSFVIKGLAEVERGRWGIRLGGYYFFDGIIMSRSRAREMLELYETGLMKEWVAPRTPGGMPGLFQTLSATLYIVLLDRSNVIIKADVEATKKNLEFIKNDVNLALAGRDFYVEMPIESAVRKYGAQLEQSRALFLVASLPVIALGIYLAMIGIDVGFGRRRAEIALLRSRGASNRQISGLLFTEASVLGIAAGLVGLFLGALITGLIIFPLPQGQRAPVGLSEMALLGVSPATMAICITLGIAMMVLASYRPIRRISRIGVIEAMGKYSVSYETEEYRKTTDVILILLPSSVYAAILLLQGQLGRGPSLLVFVLYVFMAVGALILPVTPFMLILGTARLLTRGTNRTYQTVSRAFKPLVGVLHPLVAKNLSRNPRRTSRVAVLIALSLSFGTFIMVFSATEQRFQESLIVLEQGSDIKITDSSPVDEGALRSIEGVEATCQIVQRWAQTRSGDVAVYSLDPDKYYSCTKDNGFFTRKLGRLLNELSTEKMGTLVLNTRRETEWEQGQLISLPIRSEGGAKTIKIRILGYFDHAPGLEGSLRRGRWDPPILLVRQDHMDEQIALLDSVTQFTILVKEERGANSSAIIDAIVGLYPELSEWNVRSTRILLAEREREPMLMAVFSFMELEFGFTLIMATFGLGLVMYLAATERENEVAGLMARGLSGGQVMKVLAAEAFSIVIIGFAIGVPVGTFIVYVLRSVMNRVMELAIPIPFVFPTVLSIMLVVTAAALAAASFLSAVKISRIKASDALRVR